VPENRRSREPVFVDRTGRRRRLIALAGSTGGLLLTVAVLALVAGFTGVGPASVPGWPESAAGKVGEATATPEPARRTAGPRPRTDDSSADAVPTGGATTPGLEATSTPLPLATPTAATPSTSPAPTKGRGHKPTQTPGPRTSRTS
jgi:hypothetical protein